MSNMRHCQFHNTYSDLRKCYEDMDETNRSDEEKKYRLHLIKLCVHIASDYGDEIE